MTMFMISYVAHQQHHRNSGNVAFYSGAAGVPGISATHTPALYDRLALAASFSPCVRARAESSRRAYLLRSRCACSPITGARESVVHYKVVINTQHRYTAVKHSILFVSYIAVITISPIIITVRTV